MSVSEQRDLYDVLGVPRDADATAVKTAFRRLAMHYHPDRNRAPDAEGHFKEIAKAYAVLSDPKKRAQYDSHGHPGVADFSHEDLYGGIDFEDIFGGPGFDFDGLAGTPYDKFSGMRQKPDLRGQDQEVELLVPLERVAAGGEETLRYTRDVRCTECQGTGAMPGTTPQRCDACEGSGEKIEVHTTDGVSFRQAGTCPKCGGRGVVIEKPCNGCGGVGYLEREATVTLHIPVGVEEGMVLRVPEHGTANPSPGGTAGDLYVVVHTIPDPRFERRGNDLWRTERLAIPDAVLGTHLEIPTLDGFHTLEVPPGTQPGSVLRMPDKGLPDFRGHGQGELLVRIEIHIPDSLSVEEVQLYRRLRDLGHSTPGRARHGKAQ